MTLGAGKYDDLCTYVREQSGAHGAIVIIFGGHKGGGFSVQADMTVQSQIPEILEHVARTMRADLPGG